MKFRIICMQMSYHMGDLIDGSRVKARTKIRTRKGLSVGDIIDGLF